MAKCDNDGMPHTATARDFVVADLNLAAAFADRVIALHNGRVFADAPPAEVLAPPGIRSVFGVSSEMHFRPDGKPWIVYGE